MNSRLVLILGLAALGILDFVCIRTTRPAVEKELLSRSVAVLKENQIPSGGVSFDGRDALLAGVKGSPEVSDRAKQLVQDVEGVRIVTIEFIPGTLAPPVDPVQAKLDAMLRGKRIEFAGQSATLTAAGRAMLDRIVPILAAAPEVDIEIRELTNSRAAVVKAYLVAKGIAPIRLSAIGTPGGGTSEFAVAGGK